MLLLIYQRYEKDKIRLEKGFDKLRNDLKSFQSLQIIDLDFGL